MRLFKRSRRPRTAAAPTARERRARRRTEEAEARLLNTERRIHEEAARVRGRF